MDIPNSWTPSEKNINALPQPLRQYILGLQMNSDPAGTLHENFWLRQENVALRKECKRLATHRPVDIGEAFGKNVVRGPWRS